MGSQESRQRPPVCVLHGNDSGRNRRIDAANFRAERKLDPPRHFADAKAYIYLYFIYIYYNFAFGRMESRNVVAWIDRLEVKFSLREIIFEYSFLQKL